MPVAVLQFAIRSSHNVPLSGCCRLTVGGFMFRFLVPASSFAACQQHK